MQQIPVNPRIQLRDKVVGRLSSWACEDEMPYLRRGAHYLSTEKLSQMHQLLLDPQTTHDQKAILTKTVLTRGHLDFMKHKIDRGILSLSLPLLMTIGVFVTGIHGMVKDNKKEQLSAIFMGMGAYFFADRTKEKVLEDTKDSRCFFRILGRDKEQQQRVDNEYEKWFAQSQQR